MAEIALVVQGDDFGMCHAVNVGAVSAFTEGILTQTSAMVPCPWFDEAAALAAEHSMPTGIHLTLTCEWDHLRWRPLTSGASLAGPDGTFHRTVEAARDAVLATEATDELLAQVERFRATGLEPTHFDTHMGVIRRAAYSAVCQNYARPFIYPVVDEAFRFDSIAALSERSADAKLPWMLAYLEALEPGVHILVTHVGVPGPELASITRADSPSFRWAEEYRAGDLDVVTSPEVRQAIERRGIKLTSVGELAKDV